MLLPQSFGGFWTITIAVIMHTALVTAIVVVFLVYSRFSFVGDHWQAIIQLFSFETQRGFENSSVSTDREMRKRFYADLDVDSVAQLIPSADGESAKVVVVRKDTLFGSPPVESGFSKPYSFVEKGILT